MRNLRRASVKQLAYKISGYSTLPRFAFFLGAGASRQSGIITAGEMIRYFKERIILECCPDELKTEEDKEKWLGDQDWYKGEASEYCKLFEQYEPKEIGRQRYIESIIEGKEPSFGYVVLANLMASNLINTVITTNFDDLVYSACTSYAGIRPIVYAYGVLASEMRITAQRTKVLKLHGDYLYSALKNTDTETAMQEPNMERQVIQVCNEYGLIAIGYSGGDKSIMNTLSRLSPKNDLYWCVKRGNEINEAVEKLLTEKGGYLVEIDGFDELMNEVRHIVGFDVGKMFGSIQDRQKQMIEKLKDFAPRYSADILGEVVEALQNQAKRASKEEKEIRGIQALDFFARAFKANGEGDFNNAEALYLKVVELNPQDGRAYNNLGDVIENDHNRLAEAEAAYRKAIQLEPKLHNPYGNLAFLYLKMMRYSDAETHFLKAIELNPKYAHYYNGLSIALYRGLERYVEAESASRKAIEIDPSEVGFYNSLVLSLRLQKLNSEALQAAERGLQVDPKHSVLLLSLAAIHKKLGHETEFNQVAQRAREQMAEGEWYNLACLESIAGNTDAAIENLRHAFVAETIEHRWARRDPDLNDIRSDPRFKEIVGQEENET